jgi:hypothetical protein
MLILKHLKTLQHVSIIIQIIFRELVGSLLKSLNLKIFKKCKKSIVVTRQHNAWCVRVMFCVGRYVGAQHTSPHRTSRAHTKRYAAASPQFTFYIFKFIDFNKEPYKLPEDDPNNDRNTECF